jgi:predicted glycoside hydrolase/deacetylase ChbG (UPF0249 family)
MTRIWLVADDYGISRAVNHAIRDLIEHGRLSATSVMTVAPGFDAKEAQLLLESVAASNAAIGLHLTLTAPYAALSPTYPRRFSSIGKTFALAALGQLDRSVLAAEVRAQIAAFTATFGRHPDFIDGHQHVHLLPPVADALLSTMREMMPGAWARQCGRNRQAPPGDRKALVLDFLSRGFRRRAARYGVPTNTAFAGTYDFGPGAQFAELFASFLAGMPDGGLIMCHPGMVDEMLVALDPLTTLRQREYDFFRSDAFLASLSAHSVTLR